WMNLEVLLRGVGIGRLQPDPALGVIEHAQAELRAFAELAAHVGPENSDVLDLSDLGQALADISGRLEIAHELLERAQGARGASREGRRADEPPEEPEPPSSDGDGEEQG